MSGNHKLLEKMNSISSVDTDLFKETSKENNFAKNNLEKGYKESPTNLTKMNNTDGLHVSFEFNLIKVFKSNLCLFLGGFRPTEKKFARK